MTFETQGIIHEIFKEQQISDSFKKREFILEVEDGSYNQYVKFQTTQDRCSILDGINKGDTVVVSFNLQGKPFDNKEGKTVYFTNINAWRVEVSQSNETTSFPSIEGNDFDDTEPPF